MDSLGDPQPFENLDSYTAKKIPDRFTLESLNEYCHAVGIERDNSGFYESVGLLIEEDTSSWTRKPSQVSGTERLHHTI